MFYCVFISFILIFFNHNCILNMFMLTIAYVLLVSAYIVLLLCTFFFAVVKSIELFWIFDYK